MATDRSLIDIGSIIEDNDPKMKGRRLIVQRFIAGKISAHSCDVFAICDSPVRKGLRINVSRIHTDGKSRRSGFSLLREIEQ